MDGFLADTGAMLAAIDEEHRRIAELAARVQTAVDRNRQHDAAGALAALAQALDDHFAAEEAAMLRIGYPALESHRADHEALVAGLAAIRLALASETLAHLGQGLADHVQAASRHVEDHDRSLREALEGPT